MTPEEAKAWISGAVRRSYWQRHVPPDILAYLDPSDTQRSAVEFLHGPSACPRGRERTFKSVSKGWLPCERRCACVEERRLQTSIARYGVPNPAMSPEVRRKTEATNIARYGAVAPAMSADVQARARSTNRARRGVDFPTQDAGVCAKREATVEARYGVKNVFASEEVKRRSRETTLKKRGVAHPMHDPAVKLAVASTNLRRRGVENPGQCAAVKAKMESTSLNRYGVRNAAMDPAVRARAADTLAARHGVDSPMRSQTIRAKAKQTNLDRLGFENPFQSPAVMEKARRTMREAHGVEHPMRSAAIRARAEATHLDRVGARHPKQAHILPELRLDDPDSFAPYAGLSAIEIAKITGYAPASINRLARRWDVVLRRSKRGWENAFAQALASHSAPPFVRGHRGWHPKSRGMEIDFYFPEQRIGVELNGVYWHSTAKNPDINRHREKYLAARAAGISLIQIFEDEWAQRESAVFTSILHRLGVNRGIPKVAARHCTAKEIPTRDARGFLEKHHHFGAPRSSLYLGLESADALVAVMSFRHEGDGLWELQRYATDGRVVIGGAGKLLRAFEIGQAWTEIKTFADLRWSEGALYEKLGFVRDGITPPDYRYLVDGKRLHKFGFRLDSPRFAALSGSGLTESELAMAAGFHRVYDAGRIRFLRRASPA